MGFLHCKTGVICLFFLQSHHKASLHAKDVPHIVFDYHQECRGGNTKNLAKLKLKVEKCLKSFSLFYAKGDEVIRYIQVVFFLI